MLSIVWVKLPSSGIGNKLSVWSRGIAFSEINNLPLIVTGWLHFRIGPFLRRETKKRIYWGYFQSPSINKFLKLVFGFFFYKSQHTSLLIPQTNNSTLYIFDEYLMSFNDISPYRNVIQSKFHGLLSKKMNNALNDLIIPDIGIHIRRGDFTRSGQITPISFYVTAIGKIRELFNKVIPVVVYTDAHPEEINDLLSIDALSFASPKADILDLIELSRSRVMIAASRSTFSYWACFLGNSLVIKHKDEWYPFLRGSEDSTLSNEWVVNDDDFNKINLIQALQKALT
jgi:hypothetical protein